MELDGNPLKVSCGSMVEFTKVDGEKITVVVEDIFNNKLILKENIDDREGSLTD